MNVHCKINRKLQIRLCHARNLIFFVPLIFLACTGRNESTDISVQWRDDRAISLRIPKILLKDLVEDSLEQQVQVVVDLSSVVTTGMLGRYHMDGNDLLFEPLIPLTRGLTYNVVFKGNTIGVTTIPLADRANASALLSVYPTQDTVPENMLKFYINFSKPMREGKSLEHVHLLKNGTDTVQVFLDLQPELWSNDSRMITLWLDPGRIKRDLIPNRTEGIPIEKDNHYTLIISGDWKDKQGLNLGKDFATSFFVASRDSLSPDVMEWHIITPHENSFEAVNIIFNESLDYGLLPDVMQILDEKRTSLRGTWMLSKEEKGIQFMPELPWKSGTYTLQVEGILEDISGNNLNRPFDRDTYTTTLKEPKAFHEVQFTISSNVSKNR